MTHPSTAPARPDFSLRGRLALLTGSTAGLGLEVAKAFAASGASVIINGRNLERLQQVQAELADQGLELHYWHQDVSQLEQVADSFQALQARFGTPDILFNNVGQRLRSRLQDANWSDVESLIQVDLLAPLRLSQLVAQAMLKHSKPNGRIITVTSIAGELARYGDAIYPIAKQGLSAMVRALAVEFGPHGITSNGIAPGTFATESNAALAADPEKGPLMVGRNPLGRWAQPSEISGAAVFLASASASYVNGHILVVDGGFSITF